LIFLAQFYSADFSEADLVKFNNQLETYIVNTRSNSEFSDLNRIGQLAKKLVQNKKDGLYPLVYKLLKLALVLPVAIATVERAFSAMNIIKSRLRIRKGDEWLNDVLVAYIKKDVFDGINTEAIFQHFQALKPHRYQLQ